MTIPTLFPSATTKGSDWDTWFTKEGDVQCRQLISYTLITITCYCIVIKIDISLVLNLLKCTVLEHFKYIDDWRLFFLSQFRQQIACLRCQMNLFQLRSNTTANFFVLVQCCNICVMCVTLFTDWFGHLCFHWWAVSVGGKNQVFAVLELMDQRSCVPIDQENDQWAMYREHTALEDLCLTVRIE